jgi:hypothetical protein
MNEWDYRELKGKLNRLHTRIGVLGSGIGETGEVLDAEYRPTYERQTKEIVSKIEQMLNRIYLNQ